MPTAMLAIFRFVAGLGCLIAPILMRDLAITTVGYKFCVDRVAVGARVGRCPLAATTR